MATPWAFLSPWWRALHAHELRVVSRHGGSREQLRGLSMSIDPQGKMPFCKSIVAEQIPSFIALRDSLELALLLAIVDRRAFDGVIASANVDTREDTERHEVTEFSDDESPSHVELRFTEYRARDPVVVELVVAALSVFITTQRLEERDPAFQDARLQILAQIRPSETAKRRVCEKVKVSVGVPHSHAIAPVKLMQLVHSVQLQAKATYPFVAAGFELHVKQSVFTPSASPQIETWLKRSRPFDRIIIPYEPQLPLAHFGRALAAAIQPNSFADSTGKPAHVSVYEISDHDRFVQVFSALMHTRTVHSLTVSLNLPTTASKLDRHLRLRWFLFALFSRWATHSISHVRIDRMELDTDERRDLRHFSRRSNPLPLLFDDGEANESVNLPAKQVLVRKNARLQLELSPRRRLKAELDCIVLSEEVWLDVISEDTEGDGGWFVLVPAYGKCRLHCADSIQERILEARGWNGRGAFHNCSVKSLSSVRGATLAVVAPFVRVFGRSLETLSLRSANGGYGDALFVVLARCGSLKRLALPLAFPSILPHIVNAYETGACKATHLDLRFMHHSDPLSHVVGFYEALADPNQRISQIVRELFFGYNLVNGTIPAPEIAAMRAMLATNTTLQYFERTCKRAQNEAFVQLCDEYNAARHTTTYPLAPRSKRAFLSVVSSTTHSTRAMLQVDSVMISRIFEMAAELVVHRAIIVGPTNRASF